MVKIGASWSAQCFRVEEETLSGPAALWMFYFLNNQLTSYTSTMKGGESKASLGGEAVKHVVFRQWKLALKLFSSLASLELSSRAAVFFLLWLETDSVTASPAKQPLHCRYELVFQLPPVVNFGASDSSLNIVLSFLVEGTVTAFEGYLLGLSLAQRPGENHGLLFGKTFTRQEGTHNSSQKRIYEVTTSVYL